MTGQHADPIGATEPVAIAEAVRALLVAIVTTGWIVIPDTTINVVVSVVGFTGSVVSTVLARRKVLPLAKLGPDGVPVITVVPPAADTPKEG
ncbi:hypothetical protein [Amycolatopsis circi]|uniref:hypothetical protein n=1 Tax=Amycolatopsis circi TaxID=871959 RepID=UPI000E2526FF|nr:hypothetical protein [Amycolatopsis circi]